MCDGIVIGEKDGRGICYPREIKKYSSEVDECKSNHNITIVSRYVSLYVKLFLEVLVELVVLTIRVVQLEVG